MNFIVHPTSGLLHTEATPLRFEQKAAVGNLFVNGLGQEDVSVFVFVVLVLFTVLDVVGEVRHLFLI